MKGLTTDRYCQLRDIASSVIFSQYDCFVALTREQYLKLKPKFEKRGEIIKVYDWLYGTKHGSIRLLAFYEGVNALIRKEVDPQDAYDYEHNLYCCVNSPDGDYPAYKKLLDIWSEEELTSLVRRNEYKGVTA